MDPKGYKKYPKDKLFEVTAASWKVLMQKFAKEKENDIKTIVKPPINQDDATIEYKNMQETILYPNKDKYDAIDGTGRMESIRRELKSNYVLSYPNMIELYDRISMIVTQMIDVERVNSGRTWLDHNKVQRQTFDTLNGRLRLRHGCGRNDDEVIQYAYNNWINSKKRRMSYK